MYLSKNSLDSKLEYDSHVHFFGVGLPAVDFIIKKDETSLTLPTHLKNTKLIKGFGWSKSLPLSELDRLCTTHPKAKFCLSYYDGHSSFVSQNLLDEFSFTPKSGKKTQYGYILFEKERDDFLSLLPKRSETDLKKIALHAQSVFNKNNIKKVRQMTGDFDQWLCLKELEKSEKLTLKIEVFFSEFMGQSFNDALSSLKKARLEKSNLLKAVGLKVFYDGSFNSNTAYVSSKKENRTTRITKEKLFDKMKIVLVENSLPIAIHTIGDLALEDAIAIYNTLSFENKNLPTLHLEHAPLFSQNTLDILTKNKLNCVFHFQPSHWIGDSKWYEENKTDLSPHKIYPFKFLDDLGYEYHFGSDAPVVPPSKESTIKGLKLIEKTISQI